MVYHWLSRYPTEGRISIRESLRIFKKFESYLLKSTIPNETFENICFNFAPNNAKLHNDNIHSCGNTMKCFTSLFLSFQQLESTKVDYIINGSPFFQLISNPNVVFQGNTMINNDRFYKYCRFVAVSNFKSLFNELITQIQFDETLPRIYFCSIVWTNINNNNINDHKFTIIKHSNTSFQLIQGYIADTQSNFNDSMNQFKSIQIGGGFGMLLSQQKYHSLTQILQFMCLLQYFLENNKFNSNNYFEMFQVYMNYSIETNNNNETNYIPSFSYTELTDSCIIGSGFRPMADSIETFINQKIE